jgi:hypothetical protein
MPPPPPSYRAVVQRNHHCVRSTGGSDFTAHFVHTSQFEKNKADSVFVQRLYVALRGSPPPIISESSTIAARNSCRGCNITSRLQRRLAQLEEAATLSCGPRHPCAVDVYE